jgi:putative flippase GtrA
VVHRRFTFAGRGPASRRTEVLGTASVLATSLVLTTLALAAAGALRPGSTVVQLVALVAATAVAAAVRFVLLRAWVFHARPERRTVPGADPVSADEAA